MKAVFTVLLLSCLGSFPLSMWAQSDPLSTRAQQVLRELTREDQAVLPSATQLRQVLAQGDQLIIQLVIPLDFLQQDYNDEIHEEIVEHFATAMSDFPYSQILLQARNSHQEFQALSDFLIEPQWQPLAMMGGTNDDPAPYEKGSFQTKGIQLTNQAQPEGLLAGKTIWLSAGHGWRYDMRRHCFNTQRTNSNGLVEDFATAEIVNYHLLRYLYQAGASVWTVRERDMNEQEVIVDNDQGSPYYQETGKWTKSKTNGYQGHSYRYALSRKKADATAQFTPDIPEPGLYWVSVYFVNGLNRSVDTRYKIIHAGGESMVTINQEIHGHTWVYLGQFYFEKGNKGKVVLLNESTETGQAVIADAVRFGGGKGTVPDCDSGRKSGEPRFEESAQFYARYQGFPHCGSDVLVRPKYAEWELAKGSATERKNALYLSWHTNASDHGGSGSESYIHSRHPVKGSRELRDFIHREIIRDIRTGWDENWRDRGAKSADFGELRGLETMPGVLLEVAFHDHARDANALSTPAFRDLVARSVYKGIVRYFAAKDRRSPVFLPQTPSHLTAVNGAANQATITWQTPVAGGIYGDPATAYKIYYSQHPKAFAESVNSSKTTFTFTQLQPGTTYYFRVAALNAGGESFPSPVVALRTPEKNQKQSKYLIVDGFDRLDKGLALNIKERLPAFAPLGDTRRLFLERMNNYDYAGEHAGALEKINVYFDGASNEAIAAGKLNLKTYDGIDWYLGRESANDEALSIAEIHQLKSYLDSGGNLIISGSELAYALDFKKQDASFYQQYLKASYQGDDSRQSSFVGLGFYHNLNGKMGGENYYGYAPFSPDIIKVANGSTPILHYADGQVAAVAYKGTYGMVNFAFPLETIGDVQLRTALLQKAVAYFEEEKGSQKLVLADLPDVFGKELRLDLGRRPEGRASFELKDKNGEKVLTHSWNHTGGGQKIFTTDRLPPALYEYRLEWMGLEQKGFVLKE